MTDRTSEVTIGSDVSIIPVLRDLAPGDTVIYHLGDLASDRESIEGHFNPVSSIAAEAWFQYCQGRVLLTQRKVASANQHIRQQYEYIATGTTPPYRMIEDKMIKSVRRRGQ